MIKIKQRTDKILPEHKEKCAVITILYIVIDYGDY